MTRSTCILSCSMDASAFVRGGARSAACAAASFAFTSRIRATRTWRRDRNARYGLLETCPLHVLCSQTKFKNIPSPKQDSQVRLSAKPNTAKQLQL